MQVHIRIFEKEKKSLEEVPLKLALLFAVAL